MRRTPGLLLLVGMARSDDGPTSSSFLQPLDDRGQRTRDGRLWLKPGSPRRTCNDQVAWGRRHGFGRAVAHRAWRGMRQRDTNVESSRGRSSTPSGTVLAIITGAELAVLTRGLRRTPMCMPSAGALVLLAAPIDTVHADERGGQRQRRRRCRSAGKPFATRRTCRCLPLRAHLDSPSISGYNRATATHVRMNERHCPGAAALTCIAAGGR